MSDNSRPKVFEFVIVLHPTSDEKDGGKTSEIIGEGRSLAMDTGQATLLAGRQIPDKHLDKLDRLEVAVRPF